MKPHQPRRSPVPLQRPRSPPRPAIRQFHRVIAVRARQRLPIRRIRHRDRAPRRRRERAVPSRDASKRVRLGPSSQSPPRVLLARLPRRQRVRVRHRRRHRRPRVRVRLSIARARRGRIGIARGFSGIIPRRLSRSPSRPRPALAMRNTFPDVPASSARLPRIARARERERFEIRKVTTFIR